jgi:hypothetical protein
MTARMGPMTESDFQRQVTDLAELLGWSWAHFRPAQTARGWRTPVSGPLGKGWPDLTLVRIRDRRLIFAELKRDGGKPNADQAAVLAVLGELAGSRVEVLVWRPADFEQIAEVLR